MKPIFEKFQAIAQSIEALLHPHAEVVIHDIKLNKIAAIFNAFSKRRVGDASLLSKEDLPVLADSVGPYEKTNWDGRKLKSVSSLIRDDMGKALGLLCINLDVSKLTQAESLLQQFLHANNPIEKPKALFKDDWQERIHEYIHAYLHKHHLNIETLKREEKKSLILHLHEKGAFAGKNSAHYIAKILKVSRATVYNYLSL